MGACLLLHQRSSSSTEHAQCTRPLFTNGLWIHSFALRGPFVVVVFFVVTDFSSLMGLISGIT